MTSIRTGTTGVAIALALLGAACTTDEPDVLDTGVAAAEQPATPATATPAGGVASVADITGNPERFDGQTVTVEGELEEVLSAYAFKMDDDDLLAGGIDNDLLVINSQAANLANIDDQWRENRVRVTGTVRRMAVMELERETGWDFDRQLEVELEQTRPVLVATSVERVTGG